MPEDRLLVANLAELETALDSIIDNIHDAVKYGIRIEEFDIPPIVIKISDDIPEHDSTITSSMMKSFVGFHHEINAILELANGRPLTYEEKKATELRIKIEHGSTNLWIELCKLIAAGVPNMTLEQTVVVMNSVVVAVGIICSAGILKTGANLFSKERIVRIRTKEKEAESNERKEIKRLEFEEKKAELEYQKHRDEQMFQERIAQIQKDKDAATSTKNLMVSTLTSIENIVAHSSSAQKYVYRGLAEQSETAKVSIDGNVYETEQLQELGKITRRPRQEQEEYVVNIKGKFKTEVISYVEKDIRKVNISGTGDDGEYYSLDALPVSKEALTTELYDLINEGSPLYWNLSVTMK